MDLNVGKEISGIDIYGNSIKGEITGVSNILRIVTVKIGEGRFDRTTVNFDNINK
jgi:hypothetical protein